MIPPITPPMIVTCGLCKLSLAACVCGTTPAAPTPTRFVKRGYWMCCESCGLTIAYCKCAFAPPPEVASQDGAHSSLSQRIRQHRGGQ